MNITLAMRIKLKIKNKPKHNDKADSKQFVLNQLFFVLKTLYSEAKSCGYWNLSILTRRPIHFTPLFESV